MVLAKDLHIVSFLSLLFGFGGNACLLVTISCAFNHSYGYGAIAAISCIVLWLLCYGFGTQMEDMMNKWNRENHP